jgi:hypothetical protein
MAAAFSSGVVLLARSFWMMFGPMLLTVTALVIAGAVDTGWRTTADYVYLATLVITILARWVELASGDARSGTGEPVTRSDVVRYSVIVAVAGTIVWIGANVAANYVL